MLDGAARYGIKVINASVGNPARGLPRASGLTMLFDAETARVVAVLAADRISALRTAAVTLLAVRAFGAAHAREMAVVGAGELARAHLLLFAERLPRVERFHVFDLVRARAEALAGEFGDADVRVCDSAEQAVRAADVVVPVTTTTTGYIPYGWLRPGCVVVNVSLDDVLPDVVRRADRIVVDDWGLVAADGVRLLGRLAAGASWSARRTGRPPPTSAGWTRSWAPSSPGGRPGAAGRTRSSW
ncbi:hypothetical protein [Micromonospora olivasterospora]|uniref:Ornithine cyclodeaminase n=1 Tax=Micromonospora olivasterospora TaxID=1880 RepID=A0A562I2A9_MICOL|nr:hypothetical protein [Micromonospora olivasterospora]TWH65130.1 ornithine cyclodeaminase [Micromonospora olivasterospora]